MSSSQGHFRSQYSRAAQALRSGRYSGWLRYLGNQEFSILLGLFALVGSLWGFIALAGEVGEGDTAAFDRFILLSMRNPLDISDPIGPVWMEEVGRDITALGGNAVLSLVTLVILGFLVLTRKRRLVLVIMLATLGAFGANAMLKHTYDRARPDLVPHGVNVYSASFPSAHSMLSASTYLTLGALLAQAQKRRRLKVYIMFMAIIITLLVGMSRIYLGVHWPTDVLAGWTAGAAWALLCWLLARWLQQYGAIDQGAIDQGAIKQKGAMGVNQKR